jgi:hypothetical protein
VGRWEKELTDPEEEGRKDKIQDCSQIPAPVNRAGIGRYGRIEARPLTLPKAAPPPKGWVVGLDLGTGSGTVIGYPILFV